MKLNQIDERTIALAGLLQACSQVQSLARNGRLDQAVAAPLVQSILVLDALNTPAVYGGLHLLKPGLTMLAEGLLTSASTNKAEVLRYTMSLLHLQSQLFRSLDVYQQFGAAVERLNSVAEEELYNACSNVYQKFVSEMRPQIIVQGEQEYLQQPEIPPQVRTMLLAGIRAAALWQQKGGGRFTLVWQRSRMQNAAKNLLRNI